MTMCTPKEAFMIMYMVFYNVIMAMFFKHIRFMQTPDSIGYFVIKSILCTLMTEIVIIHTFCSTCLVFFFVGDWYHRPQVIYRDKNLPFILKILLVAFDYTGKGLILHFVMVCIPCYSKPICNVFISKKKVKCHDQRVRNQTQQLLIALQFWWMVGQI